MKYITAEKEPYQVLNQMIRSTEGREVKIVDCFGQHYLGSGLSDKDITISGTPGNGVGAYLDGAEITVSGNAQNAVGDTMYGGSITVYGSCGDETGIGMQGGTIFVQGNVGFRAGIRMKPRREGQPVLVVGGTAGSFLGEYQDGGTIIVLGLGKDRMTPIAGAFCGTGMRGGKIYLRCDQYPPALSEQVSICEASGADLKEIKPYLSQFSDTFDTDLDRVMNSRFFVITADL